VSSLSVAVLTCAIPPGVVVESVADGNGADDDDDQIDFDLLLGGDRESGSNIGLIMGVSVAVPVAIAVVVLVIVECYWWYLMPPPTVKAHCQVFMWRALMRLTLPLTCI
jgi:hypothetical protein